MTSNKICLSESGRHSWRHVRNFTDKRIHAGPHGTAYAFARRGEYRCDTCGEEKVGPVRSVLVGMPA